MDLGVDAGNRDPRVFPDPDRFDIQRSPNPRLALGAGIHYCLGAPLAREQTGLGLTRLFARLPNLRLATAVQPVRQKSLKSRVQRL